MASLIDPCMSSNEIKSHSEHRVSQDHDRLWVQQLGGSRLLRVSKVVLPVRDDEVVNQGINVGKDPETFLSSKIA